MSSFNNKYFNFVPSDIIKYVYKNWKGYLSEEYWGLYPNYKTPEMLILEYKNIIFKKEDFYNVTKFELCSKKFQTNLKPEQSFIEIISESKKQTANLFDFDDFQKYLSSFYKNNKEMGAFFQYILMKKYKKIFENISENSNDRIYNFD